MYEIIFKWGLEGLGKALSQASEHEFKVMLEAVKTKNALVVQRFNIASDACAQLVDIQMSLESELVQFQNNREPSPAKGAYRKYVGALRTDFHPQYYRKYRKLRTTFDKTNDLLAGYSIALNSWINFNQIESLLASLGTNKVTDATRTYRMAWTFVASTMGRMLRASSNDLRFWLTDTPYVMEAVSFAQKHDIPAMEKFFIENQSKSIYYPALEDPEKVRFFWDQVLAAGSRK